MSSPVSEAIQTGFGLVIKETRSLPGRTFSLLFAGNCAGKSAAYSVDSPNVQPGPPPSTMRQLLPELGGNFTAIVKDLRSSKFWWGLIPGLIPVILAAMAISANVPRLILEGKAEEPRYRFLFPVADDHNKFVDLLKGVLQDHLNEKLNLFYERYGPELPATVDPVKADKPLIVEVPVQLKITNTGTLNTTIRSAEIYLVEEIDRKRITRDQSESVLLDKVIPQGGTVELKEDLIKIRLFNSARLLLDYEIARLVCKSVERRFPKERDWLTLSELYLRIMGGHQETMEHLHSLTNAETRARILLVIEIRDVYNRIGRSEITLMDSLEWTVRSTPLLVP